MSFSNRHSIYSTTSASPYGGGGAAQGSGTVTTSSLLSALHNAYQSGTPHALDASTTLVVNSSNSGGTGGYGTGVVDETLGTRAWEHARRRAEDQTILLGYACIFLLLHFNCFIVLDWLSVLGDSSLTFVFLSVLSTQTHPRCSCQSLELSLRLPTS